MRRKRRSTDELASHGINAGPAVARPNNAFSEAFARADPAGAEAFLGA
jgi:hypothetical protein